MNRTKHWAVRTSGFLSCTLLAGMLAGCVGYVEEPRRVYVAPPAVQVETAVVVEDDYVYYPSYQVYYSSRHHHYVYLEGRSWVTRPAPPRVSVDVLFRSPSVRLGFRDSPSLHHAEVVRQYPRRWSPPRSAPNRPPNRDERNRDEGRGGRPR